MLLVHFRFLTQMLQAAHVENLNQLRCRCRWKFEPSSRLLRDPTAVSGKLIKVVYEIHLKVNIIELNQHHEVKQ